MYQLIMGRNNTDKITEYKKGNKTLYKIAFTVKGILGSKRIRKQGYESYNDAIVAINTIKTLIISGKYEDYEEEYKRTKDNVKFSDVIKEYERRYLKKLKHNTQLNYKSILTQRLNPFFGSYRVDKISAKLIRRFCDSQLEQGYGGNTLSTYMCVLYSVLGFAESQNYIIRKPKWVAIEKTRKRVKLFITKEDVFKLLNNINREDYMLFASLQYSTGARMMEIAALTVEDVYAGELKININKTFASGGVVNETKNGRSGVVPISVDLMNRLVRYIHSEGIEGGYIFRTVKGLVPLSKTGYNFVLKQSARNVGIKEWKSMSSHCFRRSRAVHLLEDNCPLHLVAYLLRDEPATIVKEYVGVIESVFQQEIKKYQLPQTLFFGEIKTSDAGTVPLVKTKLKKSLKKTDYLDNADASIHKYTVKKPSENA